MTSTTIPEGTDWTALLTRTSFIELGARARATALLDDGTARELCGPFDRIESPWLEPQGVVPRVGRRCRRGQGRARRATRGRDRHRTGLPGRRHR